MMCSLEEELDAEDSAVGQESEAVALASASRACCLILGNKLSFFTCFLDV